MSGFDFAHIKLESSNVNHIRLSGEIKIQATSSSVSVNIIDLMLEWIIEPKLGNSESSWYSTRKYPLDG